MHSVSATSESENYQIRISSPSKNTILADEPVDKGGTDAGFSPQQLLAASLSACTGVTLRMYAERKGWDISGFEINVSINWDPDRGSTVIDRKIQFPRHLSDQQRERLLKVADACTVHKILSHPIAISTTENQTEL